MNDVNLEQLHDDLQAVYQKHGGRADILFGMLIGQAIRFGDMISAVRSALGDSEEKMTREEFLGVVSQIFDKTREAEAEAAKRGG